MSEGEGGHEWGGSLWKSVCGELDGYIPLSIWNWKLEIGIDGVTIYLYIACIYCKTTYFYYIFKLSLSLSQKFLISVSPFFMTSSLHHLFTSLLRPALPSPFSKFKFIPTLPNPFPSFPFSFHLLIFSSVILIHPSSNFQFFIIMIYGILWNFLKFCGICENCENTAAQAGQNRERGRRERGERGKKFFWGGGGRGGGRKEKGGRKKKEGGEMREKG